MESEPTRSKRKSEGDPEGEDGLSPSRRGKDGLTLEAITALFAQQTREIKASTSVQINEAIRNLEEKTLKRMDQTAERVEKMVQGHEGKIVELQRTTQTLLDRVWDLEDRPAPASVGSAATAGEDRRALVVGGWKPDTHKDLILADFRSLVKELDLTQLLDEDFFVPGLKHSVVIVPIALREKETEQQARHRMNKVVQVVREARLQIQNRPDGASVWAAVSRPRATRLLPAHAGKVRKCLYLLEVNARGTECEYLTGSVWSNNTLLASATRPQPKRDCHGGESTGQLGRRTGHCECRPLRSR